MSLLVLLYYALELYKWILLARVVASWVVPPTSRHPAVQLLQRLTDPVLRPLQAVLPSAGGIDFSPLVAFFVIVLLQRMLF